MVVVRFHRIFEYTPCLPACPNFSGLAGFFAFRHNLHRIGRNLPARQNERALVDDDPLDGFALGELHGLSDRRGEDDVILVAALAADELDFGWVSHGGRKLVEKLDFCRENSL